VAPRPDRQTQQHKNAFRPLHLDWRCLAGSTDTLIDCSGRPLDPERGVPKSSVYVWLRAVLKERRNLALENLAFRQQLSVLKQS
jgi:hypothetical protein